jgi:hypothetical protein
MASKALKRARAGYRRAVKTSRPGAGKRFKAFAKMAKAGGARNPAAVAAVAGRRKYGAKRFAKMAGRGRHRAAMKRTRK